MTDPTPPRAPDAVPEAVLKALRAYDTAMRGFCEDRITRREMDDTQWAVNHAIVTAIRELVAERDQEIARLQEHNTSLRRDVTAIADLNAKGHAEIEWRAARSRELQAEVARLTRELAAAQADTARLDWMQEAYGGANFAFDVGEDHPISILYIEVPDGTRVNASLRASVDNARAAGEDV